MAQLYPPTIDGTLPAFYATGTISVPFVMNMSVSQSEVNSMIIKIKNSHNDILIGDIKSTSFTVDANNVGTVKFTIPNSLKFTVGAFYKIQLAYIDNTKEVGYYSTVGIAKCTSQPTVKIDKLSTSAINVLPNQFIGTYSQKNKDTSEKVYSYHYKITTLKGKLVEQSEELIHNTPTDTLPYMSYDKYKLKTSLDDGEVYYIQYFITTKNNLSVSSPKYKISDYMNILQPDLCGDLAAKLDEENGYIELSIYNEKKIPFYPICGQYELYRLDKGVWYKIHEFTYDYNYSDRWKYRDFTIEHGVEYQYAIRQIDKSTNIHSGKALLTWVYDYATGTYKRHSTVAANFEHAFLYDGERQLKIKFNPKVNSFKTTLLEAKLDTIGGKYSTFLRNGHTEYKEFPISGLISYHSDDEELFLKNTDIDIIPWDAKRVDNINPELLFKKLPTFNLYDYNIKAERTFKLSVLDWLNNGKPKLFRSPGEGNYIVRLMNNMLTPIDTVSRMLHNFSCNAYETADYTVDDLYANQILRDKIKSNYSLPNHFITFLLSESGQQNNWNSSYKFIRYNTNLLPLINEGAKKIISLQISNATPGTKLLINNQSFVIGMTGSLNLVFEETITDIQVVKNSSLPIVADGGELMLEYVPKNPEDSLFSRFKKVDLLYVPVQQFFGENKDILNYNQLSLENPCREIERFDYIRCYQRTIGRLYYYAADGFDKNKCYSTDIGMAAKTPNDYATIDPNVLYELHTENGHTGKYYDPRTGTVLGKQDISFIVDFGYAFNNQLDLSTNPFVEYRKINRNDLERIWIGNGVIVELGYTGIEVLLKYVDNNLYQDYLTAKDNYTKKPTTANAQKLHDAYWYYVSDTYKKDKAYFEKLGIPYDSKPKLQAYKTNSMILANTITALLSADGDKLVITNDDKVGLMPNLHDDVVLSTIK